MKTSCNQQNLNLFEEEFFEERSAIREYDGEQSRKDAEAAARDETKTHIFRCLIRQMFKWTKEGRRSDVLRWLDKADVIPPGRDPAERRMYADAINQQIKLGNNGVAGDWKTKEE